MRRPAALDIAQPPAQCDAMIRGSILLAAAALGLSSPATAESSAPPCPPGAATLAEPWTGWSAAPQTGPRLILGHVSAAVLSPASAGHGGTLALTVARAGTYRIALSVPGWIDVSGADGMKASSGHSHGPACSGIRKIVAFALEPGTYEIRIARSPVPQPRIMVIMD